MQCSVKSLSSGEYTLEAALADGRALYSAVTLSAKFSIDSVMPQEVSLAGGTELTITGAA